MTYLARYRTQFERLGLKLPDGYRLTGDGVMYDGDSYVGVAAALALCCLEAMMQTGLTLYAPDPHEVDQRWAVVGAAKAGRNSVMLSCPHDAVLEVLEQLPTPTKETTSNEA